MVLHRIAVASIAVFFFSQMAPGQQDSLNGPVQANQPETSSSQPPSSKHVLGIIPNFRTTPEMVHYEPILPKEKFRIASQDSFDRGTLALAAIFAAQAQFTNGNPSFGQGVAGYSKYLATAWGDFAIGNYMTEGIFPTLLHQDPRYFRRGRGSTLSRLGYAAGQIFLTHGDSGHTQFNFSEVVGNSVAVAISNAYYADNRTARDAGSKLGVQLGVDMASNVAKEFWPDLERRFGRKHHRDAGQ
ncbi:MAG: hypothetical protein ABUS51_01270 [Acidobacteriota bacterium]